MENVVKQYPEFGYAVTYSPSEDNKVINWEVRDKSDDLLMNGVFRSDNYYRSTFNILPSNIEENIYENLFYLYFENIKLDCISMIEDLDENIVEEIDEVL